MTTGQSQDVRAIQVPEGCRLCVEFMGAGGQLLIKGQIYFVDETGLLLPANNQQDRNLAQSALKVGQRLRDETVVLSFNPDTEEALILPAEIFGGESTFDNQKDVVASVNEAALHGHSDWRLLDCSKWDTPDDEGKTLAANWAEVTTKVPEWFWVASSFCNDGGRLRRGGYMEWSLEYRSVSHPVPVVRRVPACSLDI